MNKLPKDKRNRIIAVAVATAVVVGALWVVLVNPLRSSLARASAETRDARARLTAGQKTLAAMAQVSNEVAQARLSLAAAEDAMASGDLYVWMIQTMNRFKANHQVEIPQIGKESPCEVGVFPTFPYQAAAFGVRGKGYYHDIGRFVADFENAFPYMRIQNLELDPAGGVQNPDDETLQFRLEIVTLIKPVAP